MNCSIEKLPPYHFNRIHEMAPFTKGQMFEDLFFAQQADTKEQIILLAKDCSNNSIIGVAVVFVDKHVAELRDFFVTSEYRKKGVGRKLLEAVEKEIKDRSVLTLTTSKSLHADNLQMQGFLHTSGFEKNDTEIHYFKDHIAAQEKRINMISKLDYSRFIPEGYKIVDFKEKYFHKVFELISDLMSDLPFYSEQLVYQTLLFSSERYSQLLVNTSTDDVDGCIIYSTAVTNLHFHFSALRPEIQGFGLLPLLVGVGLNKAYQDGIKTWTYVVYKTDRLFKEIKQIFNESQYVVIQMEKSL